MELKYYTVEEVTELLKVTKVTLYSHIKSGKLVGKKVGRKWIFTEQQIKDFAELKK